MTDKRFRTTLWAILIIFIILSSTALTFLVFWVPRGEGGKGIRIAILDSGINLDASISNINVKRELDGNIILEKSFATQEYGFERNYTIKDDTTSYHGTRVALIVGGRSEGIAPESELVIARCTDSDGTATYAAFYAAIQWAINEAKVDIINISIGGGIILNDTTVEAINQAATDKGVLTVVSAGNNGDSYGFSKSSIEGPGDALQAITVGAYSGDSVASYSSVGPLKDHRLKPDLVDSGYFYGAIGTSFAAPRITAKAAVLMSWCKEQGFKPTPGLIKASLMTSASQTSDFQVEFGGAGLPDIDLAKEIISDAQRINGVSIVNHVSPDNLPFGLSKVFRGDVWHFPLTLVSPIEQSFTITTYSESGDSIISVPSNVIVNQSGIIDLVFTVPEDFTLGTHEETVTIEGLYGIDLELVISVSILEPDIRIGFDIYHSLWQFDNLFGQFSELREYLANVNVALTELTHPDNYTDLTPYDSVIMADSCSYGSVYNTTTNSTAAFSRTIANETITSLTNYVDSGNGLFIISTSNSSSNLNALNSLVNQFNMTIEESTIPPIILSINNDYSPIIIDNVSLSHPITNTINSFDYIGSTINITGSNVEPVAWSAVNVSDGGAIETVYKIVLAAYENSYGGRVVLTGSNFMFDNYGLNNLYNPSTENLELLYNIIEWISNTSLAID